MTKLDLAKLEKAFAREVQFPSRGSREFDAAETNQAGFNSASGSFSLSSSAAGP